MRQKPATQNKQSFTTDLELNVRLTIGDQWARFLSKLAEENNNRNQQAAADASRNPGEKQDPEAELEQTIRLKISNEWAGFLNDLIKENDTREQQAVADAWRDFIQKQVEKPKEPYFEDLLENELIEDAFETETKENPTDDPDDISDQNAPETNEESFFPPKKALTHPATKSPINPMTPILPLTCKEPNEKNQTPAQTHLLLQDLTPDSIKKVNDVLCQLKSSNEQKEITLTLNGTEGDIKQTEILIQFLRLPPKITTTTILLNHAEGPLAALLLAGHRICARKNASLQIHAPSLSNQDHIFWSTVNTTAQTLLPNLIRRLQEKTPPQPPEKTGGHPNRAQETATNHQNMSAWVHPAHAIVEASRPHLTKNGRGTLNQAASLHKPMENHKTETAAPPQLAGFLNKFTDNPRTFTNPFDIYSIIKNRWTTALHQLQTPPPPNLLDLRHELITHYWENDKTQQNPENNSEAIDNLKSQMLSELWSFSLCLAFILHQTSTTLTAPDAFHLGLVHALINAET
jgi:ATP-dependent protease ClpP protease subunit